MRKQKGLSLVGTIAWAVVLIFAALLAFQIGPAYIEYYAIQKNLRAIAKDPEVRSGERRAIERSFALRAAIDDMTAISPGDLNVEKDGDGIIVSASYSKRMPLFGNINICLDFNPSSAK